MCVSSVNLWCGSYLGPAIAVDGVVLLVFLLQSAQLSWPLVIMAHGQSAADCLLTVASSVLVNRSPLLFNGCCKQTGCQTRGIQYYTKMSVTRPLQWSGRLLCMLPIVLKMQLEVVCKTVCGWMNWHHMYHVVVSLLCAEVMSHVDLNSCIPMSVVKFQSVCHCILFKGQGHSWVNCRVCTLGEDVLELCWIDMSTTAVVMQNHNF